ncbi:thioredoxin [Halalkaliarchaeum desulfuricum]|uniref:Thioredoxin n=1 Tax=Halalkaliarchaeum desulfuricum TaxID=2055893 RepID=A0A343TLK1_9EURY|nr:thioredoxin [Halalkaliarchaeum desulfuricum]AUX09973.1 thioredoxin [Halalkaliarchaeum desulfuricum]
MSDTDGGTDDELEEIRERKRRKLREKLEDGTPGESASGGASSVESVGTDHTESSAPPDEPIELETPDRFDVVVSKYDTVLVDFHAEWCGPCKMMEPAVKSVARETDAAVLKVDIDRHQGLASKFGVRSVPTLVLFRGGEPAQRVMGAQSEAALKRLVSG